MASNFSWLSEWYQSQCNGDWEHRYGISIDTLDNPGWYIRIDLVDTGLEEVPFDTVESGEVGGDGTTFAHWYTCQISNGQFLASCGSLDLETAIKIFREWSDAHFDGIGGE